MEKIAESFKALDDDQLLAEVKVLVAREREVTTMLIMSLAEVEGRELYLGLGFPSLFRYCTDELQLSRSAAFSRIRAARTIRAFPAAAEHLAEGSVTLTNLNVMAPHLTAANHLDLLNAARYQTKEEVEAQMAALSPGAVALVSMHLRVPVATRDKFRYAQDLLRHAIPDGDAAKLLDRALTLLIEDAKKKKLAEVKRPRRPRKIDPDGSRYIPAWIKRAVYRRDGGQCKFVGSSGRCPATGFLQYHHLISRASGGRTSVDNLELRCQPHNLYEAKLEFGSKVPYADSS
jgi:hypothetical protein